MIEIMGTASLVISKVTKLSFEEFKAMFDANNSEDAVFKLMLPDGSVHNFKVEDFFLSWEESEEIEEEIEDKKVSSSLHLNDTHALELNNCIITQR